MGQGPDLAGERRRFQVFQGLDPEFLVQDLDHLRPEAVDSSEAAEVHGRLAPQLLVIRQRAGLEQNREFLPDALADAGDLANRLEAAAMKDLR